MNVDFSVYQPSHEEVELLLRAPVYPGLDEWEWSSHTQALLESLVAQSFFSKGSTYFDPKAHSHFLTLVRSVPSLDSKGLLQAHRVMMGAEAKSFYRKSAVAVGVQSGVFTGFVAPRYDVRREIEWMFARLSSASDGVACMSFFIFFFLHVHPFHDGNGRILRVVLTRLMEGWGRGSRCAALLVLAFAHVAKADFIHRLWSGRISGALVFHQHILEVLMVRHEVESIASRFGVDDVSEFGCELAVRISR